MKRTLSAPSSFGAMLERSPAIVMQPFRGGSQFRPIFEFARAHNQGLFSNKEATKLFSENPGVALSESRRFFWTGTVFAYEFVGRPFGKTVDFGAVGKFDARELASTPEECINPKLDSKASVAPLITLTYSFEVPHEHRGKKNHVLVAEQQNLTIEMQEGPRLLIKASEAGCLPLPYHNEWYSPDEKYGLPVNSPSKEQSENLHLWRRGGPLVSAVLRVGNMDDENMGPCAVYLNSRATFNVGTLIDIRDVKG